MMCIVRKCHHFALHPWMVEVRDFWRPKPCSIVIQFYSRFD